MTLSTSAKALKKHLLWNLGGTLFLALFGAVYEIFSHEVYSYFMLYAFAVPLVLSVVPYTWMLVREKDPPELFLKLWSASVAFLGTGCAFMGVLAIYGTTNHKILVYPIAGVLLMAAALVSIRVKRKRPETE